MNAKKTAQDDREHVLMLMSALLDGELGPAEEQAVFDAMSQDPSLADAFEALTAARGSFQATLSPGSSHSSSPLMSDEEGAALTAGILAATEPDTMPAGAEGALSLGSLFVDDALDNRGRDRLESILTEKPALAAPLAGFVASVEAVQRATRAVAEIGSVVESLRMVPDAVGAQVAARERLFTLASADLDGALTPAEAAELEPLCAREPHEVFAFASAVHVGEALRLTSSAPSFVQAAAKAGAAALHVLDAEKARAVVPAAVVEKPQLELEAHGESFFERLWRGLVSAKAPLALAAAAAAVFFVVRAPSSPDEQHPVVGPDSVATRDELVKELAPTVLADNTAPSGDLPVLADNSADVEAIDATNTTVVFATDSSNITVIWVDDNSDDAQGT